MSKSKTVMLNSSDLPSHRELIETISRLKKDHALLMRIQGKTDVEDPECLKRVAGFLEILALREKKKLPKQSDLSTTMEIMIDIVARHLLEMSDWERRQTIQETQLSKVFRSTHID